MLAELRIRDFAIIDELDLSFGPGLSVLTGETGAGKSIIVDAVELVLGSRADTSVVRSGADRTMVEAAFRLKPERIAHLEPLLAQEGLEGDEHDVLIVGREVRVEGRNFCRVNGRTVTLGLLRTLVEGLVDIHGQSEHLSLLRTSEQLRLLDRYAGTVSLRQEVADLVSGLRETRHELADVIERQQELAQRADLLDFQIREIAAADLAAGEQEALVAERARLANAEELAALVAETLQCVAERDDSEPTALDLIGAATAALERLARIDGELGPLLELGLSVSYQIEELAQGLRDYREQIELSPRRLAAVQDRLALIRRLVRKYGSSVGDVMAYATRASRELERVSHSDERIADLRTREDALLAELCEQASRLSTERRAAAQRLAQAVERELEDLGMEGARFGILFAWRPDDRGVRVGGWATASPCMVTFEGESGDVAAAAGARPTQVAFDASGVDRIEFLVSPNPGEPLKPVTQIASGGETSRLMLGLKSVLSRADEIGTLVFDEIDQGIGGRVGATVGEKLWGLTLPGGFSGSPRQVLCVTHLPQLAGFGDVHMHVAKTVQQGRTVTRVEVLDAPGRTRETVKMIGAAGSAGRQTAEEMLSAIAERKEKRRAEDAALVFSGG